MTAATIDWAGLHQARLEDLLFMAEHGETATRAAQRLGMTPAGLEKWTRDHPEARPAWARLRAHENPTGHGLVAR